MELPLSELELELNCKNGIDPSSATGEPIHYYLIVIIIHSYTCLYLYVVSAWHIMFAILCIFLTFYFELIVEQIQFILRALSFSSLDLYCQFIIISLNTSHCIVHH